MATKMDVYSDHMVPFDVSAYCRQRPFAPAAVDLARALKAKNEADTALKKAEITLAREEQRVREALNSVNSFMASNNATR